VPIACCLQQRDPPHQSVVVVRRRCSCFALRLVVAGDRRVDDGDGRIDAQGCADAHLLRLLAVCVLLQFVVAIVIRAFCVCKTYTAFLISPLRQTKLVGRGRRVEQKVVDEARRHAVRVVVVDGCRFFVTLNIRNFFSSVSSKSHGEPRT
jgi:hypothetical protein